MRRAAGGGVGLPTCSSIPTRSCSSTRPPRRRVADQTSPCSGVERIERIRRYRLRRVADQVVRRLLHRGGRHTASSRRSSSPRGSTRGPGGCRGRTDSVGLRDRPAEGAGVQGRAPCAPTTSTRPPATSPCRSICGRTGRRRCAQAGFDPRGADRVGGRGPAARICLPRARTCCSSGFTAAQRAGQPARGRGVRRRVLRPPSIWPRRREQTRRVREDGRATPDGPDRRRRGLWFIEERTDVADWLTDHGWQAVGGRGPGPDGPMPPACPRAHRATPRPSTAVRRGAPAGALLARPIPRRQLELHHRGDRLHRLPQRGQALRRRRRGSTA